ncbi:ABC transporter substrate-binding protein [Sediminispirochaeta smaragdinae]|uniref:Extracellular solute-binding protein family 1 n=1 Tax=Sediminispirochaeta smaragdinae (strain DSM 11293 / JCM 15392 / SEBR 4228) TaxID=573413 RepID=E1R0U6_SEDSS|nr:extracellular solute-binding protein [Sediminispirochaeta smaragdinae]ADK80195.1 extracellular solute-binding protein family 1 [Sediminispirochaeta smaragdinae DSM 11293]
MKKLVTLLVVSLFGLTALWAGGQGESAGASSAQSAQTTAPVTIDFWTTQTQSDRMATIQVLIDTFEALNPEVTIKLVAVDENDMATQLNTAAASNTLPGMIECAAENAVAFGSEGLLDSESITHLINSIGKDKFYAGPLALNESSTKGSYYAVPYHGWVQGIWYRADWFEEAGLNAPFTWDDILTAARYFDKPDQNQYGILVGTKADAYTEQCFTQIAMANGAQLFDGNGNLIFNSPEMKEAVAYYAELAKNTPPGPQGWRARDYYLQGKMAMFFYSSYIMDDLAIEENAKDSLTGDNFADLEGKNFDPELVTNTRLASTITNTQGAGYGTIVSLAIPKHGDAAKAAAAEKFIRYLFTPNAYITWLHMAPGGMNPVLKSIAANERFQNDPKGIFKHYGKEKMEEIISGLDKIETFSIVDGKRMAAASSIYSKQIIPQMIYKITQEGMAVDAAMTWAEGEMKKLME